MLRSRGKPHSKLRAAPEPDRARDLARSMPPLVGELLVPPCFHEVNWKVGRVFTQGEDPDRVQEQWEPPPFVRKEDPSEQAASTVATELSLPQELAPSGSFARVVRRVFSPELCAQLLAAVNRKGFTPALLNIGGGRQQLRPALRDGHRVIVDSLELARWLLEVLRPHLPETFEGRKLIDLNERMRFLCYTPGQSFEAHFDGCYQRPIGHDRAFDQSEITVQIYLHDVPDSHGGATAFFPGRKGSVQHQPKAGDALLFTQDLLHEGCLVRAGLKYTLRTEAMYEGFGQGD